MLLSKIVLCIDFYEISYMKCFLYLQRCQSTLCLGSTAPDVFCIPLQEALPLAERPHLLQPNARREDLWGRHNTFTTNSCEFFQPFLLPR